MSDPRDTSTSVSTGAGGDAGTGAREPRVRDLLARGPNAAESEDLDPATIAQLAAWFGAPATGNAPPAAPEPARGQEAAERRARALEAVDPGFVAALQTRWARGEALLRVTRPVARSRPAASKFDLAVWNLHLGDPPRERELPEDMSEAFREPTPQAILRDLHRTEQHWPKRLLPTDLGLDVAGERTRATIDGILATNYSVRIDDEPIPARIMADAAADLRARLRAPWEDSYVPPEKRRAPASNAPTAEDLKWFGSMGFDPDL